MEHLPLEIICNILSCLGTVRDIIVASSTCKKWREVFKKHLHKLSLRSDDWPNNITTAQLEMIITRIIYQTVGLQHLLIHVDDAHEFRTSTVFSWLLSTGERLHSLSYNVATTPLYMDVLAECNREKLEVLILSYPTRTLVEPTFKTFTCLEVLSLRHIIISSFDMTQILAACPKIESLSLDDMEIISSDYSPMKLRSCTLKILFVNSIEVDGIVLEADNFESLHVTGLYLNSLELIGKNNLEHLKIDDVIAPNLDTGEYLDHLNIVDVSNFTIMVPQFCHMIAGASKLKKLRLWRVTLAGEGETIHSDFIADSFSELKHLALSYENGNELLYLQGFSMLENVDVLELGLTVISENFGQWVSGMVEKCPNLKKLIIHDTHSETRIPEEHLMLADITSFIVALMINYIGVDLQFVND